MRGRDFFIAGVRLIGVWLLASSVKYGVSALDIVINDLEPPRNSTPVAGYLLYVVADLALGVLFLRGAERLAHLCYGRPEADLLSDLRRFGDDEDDVARIEK